MNRCLARARRAHPSLVWTSLAVIVCCSCKTPGNALQPSAAPAPSPEPPPSPPAASEPQPPPPPTATRSTTPMVVFRGMCDASGAVGLSGSRFAVADDEDNVLRVYDGEQGGDPVYSIDVSSALDLVANEVKTPEADIEAATRLGDRALWLTSHGLSSSGQLQPSRFCFFATTAPSAGLALTPVGTAYHALLEDMLSAPELARFNLRAAAQLAAKAPGGLNIEGMTQRADGTSVLIGFRNPVPEDQALLVPLLNPLELIAGKHAKFGEPLLLPLGGRGVRSLTLWRGRYLIMAGSPGNAHRSMLFIWDGSSAPRPFPDLDLDDINPEAFVSRDEQAEVMLLSDDGTAEIEGQPCKKLEDREKKSFRGLWVRVAP